MAAAPDDDMYLFDAAATSTPSFAGQDFEMFLEAIEGGHDRRGSLIPGCSAGQFKSVRATTTKFEDVTY